MCVCVAKDEHCIVSRNEYLEGLLHEGFCFYHFILLREIINSSDSRKTFRCFTSMKIAWCLFVFGSQNKKNCIMWETKCYLKAFRIWIHSRDFQHRKIRNVSVTFHPVIICTRFRVRLITDNFFVPIKCRPAGDFFHYFLVYVQHRDHK